MPSVVDSTTAAGYRDATQLAGARQALRLRAWVETSLVTALPGQRGKRQADEDGLRDRRSLSHRDEPRFGRRLGGRASPTAYSTRARRCASSTRATSRSPDSTCAGRLDGVERGLSDLVELEERGVRFSIAPRHCLPGTTSF